MSMDSIVSKVNDLAASYVRTGVMLAVGWVLALLGRHGLHIDLSQATLDVIASGAYYGAVRLLEHYVDPRFGWLLGLAKKPQYAAAVADVVTAAVAATPAPAPAPAPEGDAAP